MIFPAVTQFEDESCPVPDDVFQKVHGAEAPDAVAIAGSLPESQRAQLAVFCYRKRHLHELGLKIASTCSCSSLVDVAGAGGRVIYDQSRDPDKTLAKERMSQASSGARPVTLATRIADD